MVFAFAVLSGGCGGSSSGGGGGGGGFDIGDWNDGPDLNIYALAGTWIPSNGSGSGSAAGYTLNATLNVNPGRIVLYEVKELTDTYAIFDMDLIMHWDFTGHGYAFTETINYPRDSWQVMRLGKNVFELVYTEPGLRQSWCVKFTSESTAIVYEEGQGHMQGVSGSYSAQYSGTKQ